LDADAAHLEPPDAVAAGQERWALALAELAKAPPLLAARRQAASLLSPERGEPLPALRRPLRAQRLQSAQPALEPPAPARLQLLFLQRDGDDALSRVQESAREEGPLSQS
jgi:hypothetical protein